MDKQPIELNYPSPYLTLKETAAYARCSSRTVQRWLMAGQLTRHGHGRRVLIDRRELETLLSPTARPPASWNQAA